MGASDHEDLPSTFEHQHVVVSNNAAVARIHRVLRAIAAENGFDAGEFELADTVVLKTKEVLITFRRTKPSREDDGAGFREVTLAIAAVEWCYRAS